MIQVAYSPAFVRAYKKYFKGHQNKQHIFQEKVDLFMQNPFNPLLKTHKLKGIMKDFFAFSIEYDLRVIFYFISESEVIFEDIGSHDEVY
jgi:addiction module RelE/StbE family toxin